MTELVNEIAGSGFRGEQALKQIILSANSLGSPRGPRALLWAVIPGPPRQRRLTAFLGPSLGRRHALSSLVCIHPAETEPGAGVCRVAVVLQTVALASGLQ